MNLAGFLLTQRRAAANACLGAMFAVVLAAELWNLAARGREWWLDCVTGVVVCGLALGRERGRVPAAMAGLVVATTAALIAAAAHLPGQPGAAAALALLVLIASVVRVCPVVSAAAVTAGGAALSCLMAGLHPDIGIGALSSWWGAAVAAGLLLRILDASRAAGIEAVRRAERLELARELHDVAAHHMTGVVLQAQAARIAARRQRPEPGDRGQDHGTLDDLLADIETAGGEALGAVRRVVGLLRDGSGGHDAAELVPGPERLTELVDQFARHGAPVRLRIPDERGESVSPTWPPEVTTTVYRVVQEALTNVIRHAAQATEVTVTVTSQPGAVTVEINDDAPASGPHRFPGSGGHGLTGMRERVQSLGGTFNAGPRPGRGWSVRAALPARR